MKIRTLAFAAVVGLAATFASAVHFEVGDASALAGGQETGSGILGAIEGSLAPSDSDMYQIRVTDWAAFSASTVDVVGLGSPESDTQLFLFDAMGVAIAMNDDAVAPYTGFCSALEVGSALYAGRTNGEIVWVAVSGYDTDPQAGGQDIFVDTPFRGTARGATGPGAAGAVDGWTGANTTGGTYRITLTGASGVPTPGALALLGLGGLVTGRRRRN